MEAEQALEYQNQSPEDIMQDKADEESFLALLEESGDSMDAPAGRGFGSV